jgi:predicted PurR-regulated permease PerM
MPDQRFRKAFLLVLVVATSVAFLTILRAFLLTILMAAVLSGLVYPLYARLVPRLRGSRHLASGVTLLLVVLLVVLPLVGVLGLVVNQAIRITQSVRPVVERLLNEPTYVDQLLQRLPGAERLAPYRDEIVMRAGDVANSVGAWLVSWVSATTRGTVNLLINAVLMLYSMFFLLIDGPAMLAAILEHVPLADSDTQRMKERFVSITRATIKGTLVIGVVQGALAGAAFQIVGIPDALFWAVVMMVLSVLPLVGGALVWAPACLYLMASGHLGRGLLLAGFCALIVGSVDNLLRPRLVGRDTKMHDLVILFSTLGGLLVFGPLGFIIGPIVAGLFVTSWAIFGAAYRDVLDEGAAAEGTPAAPEADEAGGA